MESQYIPVGVGIVWAIFLSAVLIVISHFFGPKKPTPSKDAPYECGIETLIGDARSRFSVKFYVIAMLFLLFDIEIVFMYPWAILLRQLGLMGLVAMMTFIVVLVVAFAYVWKKGALNWE
jgi:NADH-quinone oxidoreductase subunit A